jgi:Flp pilus assembly protein TadD
LLDRLYTDIEWALSVGRGPAELIPMLERLVRQAPARGPHGTYARLKLAELTVQSSPFRAARLAQQVLDHEEEDRAYAVLGLAHLLLGSFRESERAYRSALRLAPRCPWYAHNLGHLLDVGLGRPEDALPYLRLAAGALPTEPEVRSSLAHALLATGDHAGARRELERALGCARRADDVLARWRALHCA